MSTYVPSSGPRNAQIMAVAEAPGEVEVRELQTLYGTSGSFLRGLLRRAGINPDEVLFANVSRFRPSNNDITNFIKPIGKKRGWETNGYHDPDLAGDYISYSGKAVLPFIPGHISYLYEEIYEAKPRVILAVGRTALWALTEQDLSIDKWKGSVIQTHILGHPTLIIPIQHPAYILRMYKNRFHTEQYLRKAAYYLSNPYEPPKENFLTNPTYDQVMLYLRELSGHIFCDIETINRTHIECFGICNQQEEVICIPFIENGQNCWTLEQETAIIKSLKRVLTKLPVVGQNFFYDAQYVFNEWLCIPNLVWDTMLAHHTLFPSVEKSLDYQSSLYLDNHLYWKGYTKHGNHRWIYNCKDCLATKRVHDAQRNIAEKAEQLSQIKEQNALYLPVLKMMLRGVRRNTEETERMKIQASQVLSEIDTDIETMCGYPLNTHSGSPQVKNLLYTQLLQQPVISRKTKNETVDDSALNIIARREPALKPLTDRISIRRSFATINSTFLEAQSDPDQRLRYSLNIAGARTFRFASSKSIAKRGLNIQNIKRMEDEIPSNKYPKPPVRRQFIPDPGYLIVDADLKSAEFQIVVWESGDLLFKQMLREGVNIHKENAKLLGLSYDKAKSFIHAVDYLATPRTCAIQFGMTVHEAERYRTTYFSEHPAIEEWQKRTIRQLNETATITNPFGYRITYYDRLDGLSAEAVDWIPQSTIAIIIDKGIININNNIPSVQMLFQNHDSIVSQIPIGWEKELIPLIVLNMRIPVPYNDPLTIPIEVKTSEKSWGEVEKWQMPTTG